MTYPELENIYEKKLKTCPPTQAIPTSLRCEGNEQVRGISTAKQKLILFLINAANVRLRLRSGTEGTAGLAAQFRSLSGLAGSDGSSGRFPQGAPRRAGPSPGSGPDPSPASPPQPPALTLSLSSRVSRILLSLRDSGLLPGAAGSPAAEDAGGGGAAVSAMAAALRGRLTQRRGGGPAPAETRARGFGSGGGRRPTVAGSEAWPFGPWRRPRSGECIKDSALTMRGCVPEVRQPYEFHGINALVTSITRKEK